MVPFGIKKHGVSGFGNPGTVEPERTLAPLNNEYGTIKIGLVGKASKGCCPPFPEFGEGGDLQVSLGDGGADPEVHEEPLFTVTDGVTDAAELGADFTTCLVLQ